jgi:hypothetical protein
MPVRAFGRERKDWFRGTSRDADGFSWRLRMRRCAALSVLLSYVTGGGRFRPATTRN